MSAAIEVDDVHKAFNGFKVLSGLTVDFVEDAITTVLGPSGTGKSVLLKHIIALLYPDRATSGCSARASCKMNEDELFAMREGFGVLFQDGALFGSMSIYDNVAFPLRKHTKLPEDKIRSDRDGAPSGRSASRTPPARCRTRSPAACASGPASPGLWSSTRRSSSSTSPTPASTRCVRVSSAT